MSRSYKKTPYCGLPKDQFYKRYSNKKLRQWHRQHKYIPDGKAFRKVTNTWDICDFYHILSLPAFIHRKLNSNHPHNHPHKKDITACSRLWFKWYKGK